MIIDTSSPGQRRLLREGALRFRGVALAEEFAASSVTLACIARIGGRVVGWCWGYRLLHRDGGSMLYLHGLEVEPDHRGRGLGRSLLEAFTASGRAAGARTVFLFTADANEPARHLYESLGGGPPSHGPSAVYWFVL